MFSGVLMSGATVIEIKQCILDEVTMGIDGFPSDVLDQMYHPVVLMEHKQLI